MQRILTTHERKLSQITVHYSVIENFSKICLRTLCQNMFDNTANLMRNLQSCEICAKRSTWCLKNICYTVEIGTVQTNAHPVDLEKCWKIFACEDRRRYSRERARCRSMKQRITCTSDYEPTRRPFFIASSVPDGSNQWTLDKGRDEISDRNNATTLWLYLCISYAALSRQHTANIEIENKKKKSGEYMKIRKMKIVLKIFLRRRAT